MNEQLASGSQVVGLLQAMRRRLLAACLENEQLASAKADLERDVSSLGKFVLHLQNRLAKTESLLAETSAKSADDARELASLRASLTEALKDRDDMRAAISSIREWQTETLQNFESEVANRTEDLQEKLTAVGHCASMLHVRLQGRVR